MAFYHQHYKKTDGKFTATLTDECRKKLFNTISQFFWHNEDGFERNKKLIESISNEFGWGGVLYKRDGDPKILAVSLLDFFFGCHENWCLDVIDNAYKILNQPNTLGLAYDFENRVNGIFHSFDVRWLIANGKWYKVDAEFFNHIKGRSNS